MWGKKKIKTIVLEKIVPDGKIKGYDMPFTYQFVGKDGRKYILLWECDIYSNMEIKVLDSKNRKKLSASLHAKYIISENDKYLKLETIEVKNNEQRHLGIGTAMMKTFFELIIYDGRKFSEISGNFEPLEKEENVREFYESFDGYITSDGTTVSMVFQEDTIIFRLLPSN